MYSTVLYIGTCDGVLATFAASYRAYTLYLQYHLRYLLAIRLPAP